MNKNLEKDKSSRPEVFCKKGVPQACNFVKKEALEQVFSCEFRDLSKNTFFIEHLWWLLLKRDFKVK